MSEELYMFAILVKMEGRRGAEISSQFKTEIMISWARF
jgi:hypothetical protein